MPDAFSLGDIGHMLDALSMELQLEEQRRDGSRRIPLHDGRLLRSGRESLLYLFNAESIGSLLEESYILAYSDGAQAARGLVSEVDDQRVYLELDSDIGERPGSIEVAQDRTRLIVAQIETLEHIADEPSEHHPRLFQDLFRQAGDAVPASRLRHSSGLNREQRRAVRLALGGGTTFIWGPPGTGKTSALAALVAELYFRGAKVLVTANANRAVDHTAAGAIGLIMRAGIGLEELRGRFLRLSRFIHTDALDDAVAAAIELEGAVGKEAGHAAETAAIKDAQLVATTLARLSTRSVFRDPSVRFDCVIIDEAGCASLPQVLVAASLSKEGLVLAGDPAQLAPISQVSGRTGRDWLRRDAFLYAADASVAEELFAWEDSAPNAVFLNVQHRMPTALSSLISGHFYRGRIDDGPDISDAGSVVGLIDMSGRKSEPAVSRWGSRENPHHVDVAVELAEGLSERFGPSEVAVITPYRSQAWQLRRALRKRGLGEIEAATVHTFQGREKEAVILDITDGPGISPGTLIDERKPRNAQPAMRKDETYRLLNVALSRARRCLLVIADRDYLRSELAGQKLERIVSELDIIEPEEVFSLRLFR